MNTQLAALEAEILAQTLESDDQVEAFRIAYLGRKNGRITELFKQISDIAPENRKEFGQRINALKTLVQERIDSAQEQVHKSAGSASDIDLSLPGRLPVSGSIHPIRLTMEEMQNFFVSYGFSIAEGPEIEDDWHNFSALNFPPDHPARDMQDTFFIEEETGSGDGVVLRTHTSPVQIRTMENSTPPIRVIAPGRVYRNEAVSYKSFCLFHQVEGLYVAEGVNFAELREILHLFAQHMFGQDVVMRFRPSFFPFTEPSAEVDIQRITSDGSPQWLEILGCGMVDPNVLEAVGIDSEKYTGYAFGMGVERIAMLRYGIDDIRLLYENDIRFLEQF